MNLKSNHWLPKSNELALLISSWFDS